MREIVVPLVTGGFTFILGYLTYRVRNKEIKVSESAGIYESYNELIETYRTETKLRDQEIARLRNELEKKDASVLRERMENAKLFQEKLRKSLDEGKGNRNQFDSE